MMLLMILLGFSSLPDNVTEFQLGNGIHVISRTVPQGVVEGISLFLTGGSLFLDGSTQGIEAFSLEAALAGSQRFPDHRWRGIMDLTLHNGTPHTTMIIPGTTSSASVKICPYCSTASRTAC